MASEETKDTRASGPQASGPQAGGQGAPADNLREEIISRAKAMSREGAEAKEAKNSNLFDSSQFSIPTPEAKAPQAPQKPTAQTVKQIIEKALSAELFTLTAPSVSDMAVFCRQLSTLLEVGIPLLRALKILAERSSHQRLRKIVAQVARRVEEGNTLSSALREHPATFSHLFVSVIEVGELGGILEGSVRRLAELLEMRTAMRKKIRAALAYPAVAGSVCLAVIVFMMLWAVPRFKGFYDQLHAKLPKLTVRMIAFSDFLQHYWALYIPLIIIAIAAIVVFGKTKTGRTIYDWLTLNFFIIGPIATKINVARFTRSIGSLVSAGIPLLESLRVTARTSENVIIAKKLSQVHDTMEAGGRLEEPLRQDSTIPPMVVDMMVIGYESGAIDDMLLRIADSYDTDVDETLKGLSSIIEPVLIICLGCVVALVGAGLLLPYFNLVHAI